MQCTLILAPLLLMIPSTEFYVHSNFCKVTFIVFQFPDAFFDSATLVEEREGGDATRKIVLIIKVVPSTHMNWWSVLEKFLQMQSPFKFSWACSPLFELKKVFSSSFVSYFNFGIGHLTSWRARMVLSPLGRCSSRAITMQFAARERIGN